MRAPCSSAAVCLILSEHLPSSPCFLPNSSPSFFFPVHKSAGSSVPLARTQRHSRPGSGFSPSLSLFLVYSCTWGMFTGNRQCVLPHLKKTLHKWTRRGTELTLHNSIRLDPLHEDLLGSTQIIWIICTGKQISLLSVKLQCSWSQV